jgi:hypothetical protein
MEQFQGWVTRRKRAPERAIAISGVGEAAK